MSNDEKAYPSRSKMSEKEVADTYVGDFKIEGSRGQFLLEQMTTNPMTRAGLITLAYVLSKLSNIKFRRNDSRRVILII